MLKFVRHSTQTNMYISPCNSSFMLLSNIFVNQFVNCSNDLFAYSDSEQMKSISQVRSVACLYLIIQIKLSLIWRRSLLRGLTDPQRSLDITLGMTPAADVIALSEMGTLR